KVHPGSSLGQLPGPPVQGFVTGNVKQLHNLRGWEFHRHLAEEYGPAVQLKEPFGKKGLYTFDPIAMHQVLVKDGSLFQPPRLESGALLLGKGLLNTAGEHHRKQRKMLNPVFSIAHMRSMMPIFYDVVDQLKSALTHRVQSGPQEIDLLGWMARTALELIGQSGFGYSFDNMVDDVPKHKYSMVIKDLVPKLGRLGFARFYILPLAIKLLPTNVRTFIMNITPWKNLHDVRDMANYMHELSVEIYEEKKRALEEGEESVVKQIGQGKDLLSIMMRENMKADTQDKLPEEEIIAQELKETRSRCQPSHSLQWILLLAMSRILHLLALHPAVQDKLRQEIIEARKERQGENLSYDELVALPYLDAVCRETLRLYAPVATMMRKAREDTVVPLSRPVRGVDGKDVTEVFIPRGSRVWLSLLNANRSSELWGPDAMEWKPERWLSPLPESIMDSKIPGIYSHLMTFSGGTRSCM
ncbi:cytochrome P450, partial [Gymnopus androsaceus JB14]